LYNPTEIIALLESAGLTLVTIYENWAGALFNEKSGRLIIIARKEGYEG